jgi:ferrous iron transport protein A
MLAKTNKWERYAMAMEILYGTKPEVMCGQGLDQKRPLSMVRDGERVLVRSVSGKDEIRRFLGNLGFVEGTEIEVISELNGNLIVNVKGTRMAISKAMANRVLTA